VRGVLVSIFGSEPPEEDSLGLDPQKLSLEVGGADGRLVWFCSCLGFFLERTVGRVCAFFFSLLEVGRLAVGA